MLLDECAAGVDADVLYDSLDTALYSAFGHPEAVYKQMLLHTDGVQRRRADTMSGLDWAGQHGMVRSALSHALPKHDWQVLLIRYGTDDNFTARRAGARLDIADRLKAALPCVELPFLFEHVTRGWCGVLPPNNTLQAWADKTGVPYKTLARQRLDARKLLDRWLDAARTQARFVLVQRNWVL